MPSGAKPGARTGWRGSPTRTESLIGLCCSWARRGKKPRPARGSGPPGNRPAAKYYIHIGLRPICHRQWASRSPALLKSRRLDGVFDVRIEAQDRPRRVLAVEAMRPLGLEPDELHPPRQGPERGGDAAARKALKRLELKAARQAGRRSWNGRVRFHDSCSRRWYPVRPLIHLFGFGTSGLLSYGRRVHQDSAHPPAGKQPACRRDVRVQLKLVRGIGAPRLELQDPDVA